ncbi:subtilisin-like protease SBT1.4 [Lolium rigidum]|uniref:subtilisin-like protease SBT1.4 n=1 Tax=Lolium rigidum TaxID=89674 RepID=UPI001F5DCC8F|nr:subtilisin-like protease SBT1.4 [Lolium rigidum]
MELTRQPLVALCVLLAVAIAGTANVATATEVEIQTTEDVSSYIVHVAPEHAPTLSRRGLLTNRAYGSFLRNHLPVELSLSNSDDQAPRVLYSYAHAATGFAARLTRRQAAHLASARSVLAVVPDVMQELHTTLSPSFLGLSSSSGLLPASNGASDVVIGVIDTGVYPVDRASFAADPSLPPPPRKFRGRCVSTPEFNGSAVCNGKIVGAKFFRTGSQALRGGRALGAKDSMSPLDTEGHGTHLASTAAGSASADASLFGYGEGRAVGVAPGARIAVYKACWHGCASSDVLAAFDEAIADGVDVISASLGTLKARKFYKDTTAVGAFNAVRKGIVVAASAGNSGPGESTVVNVAPWFLTVGASTINREFPADVILGNGETFRGTSLYAGQPLGAAKIPLVYGGDVGSNICEAGKLDPAMVTGKIVLCDPGVNGRTEKGYAVKLAGGAGAILGSEEAQGGQARSSAHILPVSAVTFADAEKIKKYLKAKASPVATIVFRGTVVGGSPPSPRMASFSSRGPSRLVTEILKPDVTAPGVDILAAWTGAASPSLLDGDTRRVPFNIMSGTSISCPQVSGIAALLRQAKPKWSPAAIKSALMTTAYNVDNAGGVISDMSTGKVSTPFARGAGHVDPNRAVDPGLVYDAGTEDYVTFLCALGYTPEQLAVFGSSANCSARTGASVGDLNYPAFSAVLGSDRRAVTQRRTVRNVGSNVRATYTAKITSPAGVLMTVKPRKLAFSATQEKQDYAITFAQLPSANVTVKHTFGSIVWSDGKHTVTSPIAITWPASQVADM